MVSVIGGGPAGASAAIAAALEGSIVQIREKSALPRHKVCGEFLSPEILPLLERLGLSGDFQSLQPTIVRRMSVHLGRKSVTAALPDAAFGLSRYALDEMLLGRALACGAELASTSDPNAATVLATGRQDTVLRGARLFGFKAHFTGPCDDAVELYFFGRSYVGVNSVEQGRTNVCGIAPEHILKSCSFEVDGLLDGCDALRSRLQPLSRDMRWMFTGPLVYRQRFSTADCYPAGDALSFVDPFTGSGIVSAILTGISAGTSAALRASPAGHLAVCRKALHEPFAVAGVLRRLAHTSLAEHLLPIVPPDWLFKLTRPKKTGE